MEVLDCVSTIRILFLYGRIVKSAIRYSPNDNSTLDVAFVCQMS